MKPKVSCLIITYNQEHFIDETINSVLNQDYENLEIVISDDGSTDSTPEILESYQKRFPDKIKILTRQENLGITKNTNRALHLCAGDYIALIGGDDLWLPSKVTKQIEWFLANPDASICYHDVQAFDSRSKRNLYKFSDYQMMMKGGVEEIIDYGCFACASSLMIQRVDGLVFEERLPHVSDWFFALEVLIQTSKKIGYIDGIHALYRKHDHNITSLKDLSFEFLIGYKILEKKYSKFKNLLKQGYNAYYAVMFLNAISKKNLNKLKFLFKIENPFKPAIMVFIVRKIINWLLK